MRIRAVPMRELTVSRYDSLRDVLDFEPAYQREGGVWSRETRSRLIDSMLNGFDLPKLYFERASTRRTNDTGRTIKHAVLDGKQRLESITEFLRGELPLPRDFVFYEDETVRAADMTINQLRDQYPGLAQRFLDYELPVIDVITDSSDLIEEMFQRLNAATALNHAERRNSISGPTRDAANTLAAHPLLTSHSPIKSARYKHRELGAKFLAIEHQIATHGRILDTKAATLYDLFLASRDDASGPATITKTSMEAYRDDAADALDRMAKVFLINDPLLASVGTVIVYFIAFRDPALATSVSRDRLARFEDLRRYANRMSEDDPAYARPANVRLREYNVLVQSTNDGRALRRRADILSAFVTHPNDAAGLTALDRLRDSGDPSPNFDEE